jgi:hypothetical protein
VCGLVCLITQPRSIRRVAPENGRVGGGVLPCPLTCPIFLGMEGGGERCLPVGALREEAWRWCPNGHSLCVFRSRRARQCSRE